jgi:hypothetical protein
MDCREIIYSGHAISGMFERNIHTSELRQVISSGEIIAEYPDDLPFPSFLLIGWTTKFPLHIVVGFDSENKLCHVITCYIPDPGLWRDDFKTRR